MGSGTRERVPSTNALARRVHFAAFAKHPVDYEEGHVGETGQKSADLKEPYTRRAEDLQKFVLKFTIAECSDLEPAPDQEDSWFRHAFLRRIDRDLLASIDSFVEK